MRIHIAAMPITRVRGGTRVNEEREQLIKRMMAEGCDDLILLQLPASEETQVKTEAGK